MMRTSFFAFLFLLFLFDGSAQKIEPKHTFQFELGLPNGFSNKPFRQYMQGLMVLAPSYQYAFKNGLALGGGIRYHYFQVNQFRIPTKTIGGMHSASAFAKIGYQKFLTERVELDAGVKVGYSENLFNTDRNKTLGQNPYRVTSLIIEPTFKIGIVADEQVAYSFFVAYGVQGFALKPNMLGLESFGFNAAEVAVQNKRAVSFLTFGFGLTYYFKEKS
ncbi:MAG: hypothetical protein V4638_08395 [Bacteroidota bacterium]